MNARLLAATALALVAGLAGCKSRLDPDAGRKYKCDRADSAASTQCPDGWRCGFSGYCHANEEPGDRACEVAEDCASTWRCGLDNRCHDKAVAAAYLCASSGDCEQGWHCGLERVCHDPQVAAAYLCTGDEHCEKGWRCDPVRGACVDASSERLLSSAAPPSERVSPRLPWSPTLFAASELFEQAYDSSGYRAYTRSFAQVSAQGLTQMLERLEYDVPRLEQVTVPLASPATSLEALEGSAFVVDGQGVLQSTLGVDAGVRRLPFPAPVQTLVGLPRHDTNLGMYSPVLFGLGAQSYSYWTADEDRLTGPLVLRGADGGVRTLRALTDVKRYYGDDPRVLFAATDDGLYAASRTPTGFDSADGGLEGAWVPIRAGLGSPSCGVSGPSQVLRVDSLAEYYYPIALVQSADGGSQGDLYAFDFDYDAPVQACSDSLLKVAAGPCAPCPAGDTLVELHAYGDLDYPTFQRCRHALEDGGSTETSWYWDRTDAANACGLYYDPYQSDSTVESIGHLRTAATPSPVVSARLDEQGRIFGYYDPRTYYGRAYSLTDVPRLVVGGAGHKLVALSRETVSLPPRIFELGAHRLDEVQTYFYDSIPYLQLCGQVAGAPGWVARTVVGIQMDGGAEPGAPRVEVARLEDAVPADSANYPQVGAAPAIAYLSQTEQLEGNVCWATSDAPGIHAATGKLGDGGTMLYVVGGDSLWAAELPPNAGVADAGVAPVRLEIKVAPLPRARVTAVTPISVPANGPELLAGYLLAQRRLFRFSAVDEVQWRADEIRLPTGSALDVWADGANGRVGFDDGRVFSLPSRALLAQALPAGGKVLQYATLCGQSYALTATGLLRLTAPSEGGAVGVWTPMALDLAPPGGDPGYARGKLHASGNELYVFNAYGTSVRVKDPACQ